MAMHARLVLCGMLGLVLALHARASGDVDAWRKLYVDECAFDFCGVDAAKYRKDEHVGVSEKQISIRAKFESFKTEGRRSFLDMAWRTEEASRSGSKDKFMAEAKKMSSFLMDLHSFHESDDTNVFDRVYFESYLERFEYLVARAAEGYRLLGMPADYVRECLPDELFETTDQQNRELMWKRKVFRNFIAIGVAINGYTSSSGALPESLDSLNLLPWMLECPRGMKVYYEAKGKEWQLLCAGPRIPRGYLVFNVYVPLLQGMMHLWPWSSCARYSSDFSAKRLALYRDGELNKGTPWYCVMQRGYVVGSKALEGAQDAESSSVGKVR